MMPEPNWRQVYLYEVAVFVLLWVIHIKLYRLIFLPDTTSIVLFCYDMSVWPIVFWMAPIYGTLLTRVGALNKWQFLKVVRKAFFIRSTWH